MSDRRIDRPANVEPLDVFELVAPWLVQSGPSKACKPDVEPQPPKHRVWWPPWPTTVASEAGAGPLNRHQQLDSTLGDATLTTSAPPPSPPQATANAELADILPYLAPLAPSLAPDTLPSQPPDSQLDDGTSLTFYGCMFPSLTVEVIATVLLDYHHTPQLALDQLIMLAQCVEDGQLGGDAVLPDGSSWEAEEGEEGMWCYDDGTPSPTTVPGPSADAWPADPQPPPSTYDVPDLPVTEDGKVELLKSHFPRFSREELRSVLGGSNGSLTDALQLLQIFDAEETAPSPVMGCPATWNSDGEDADVEWPPSSDAPSPPLAPEHVAMLHCLGDLFPSVPEEARMVALQVAAFEMEDAKRVLREQGFGEVAREEATSDEAGGASSPAEQRAPVPNRVTYEVRERVSTSSPQRKPAPRPAVMTSKEATYLRNTAIYERERADALRFQSAYKNLFAEAHVAKQRGDIAIGEAYERRALELRERYFQEKQAASSRISNKINANNNNLLKVDLHGMHVDEALQKVEAGLRYLPMTLPGGVTVRYITGRGLHSDRDRGPQLRTAVLQLLTQQGVQYTEGLGYMDVILKPK